MINDWILATEYYTLMIHNKTYPAKQVQWAQYISADSCQDTPMADAAYPLFSLMAEHQLSGSRMEFQPHHDTIFPAHAHSPHIWKFKKH